MPELHYTYETVEEAQISNLSDPKISLSPLQIFYGALWPQKNNLMRHSSLAGLVITVPGLGLGHPVLTSNPHTQTLN